MKKTLPLGFFVLSLTALTSCTPVLSPKTVVKHPIQQVVETTVTEDTALTEQQITPRIALSEHYVRERIQQYGKKLDRWKQIDADAINRDLSAQETKQIINCFRQLQKVLSGYNGLQRAFLSEKGISHITGDITDQIQQEDIKFLDGECGSMLSEPITSNNWNAAKLQGLDQTEAKIIELSDQGDYENVLQTWTGISSSQQKRLSLKTKLLYANALTYLHQERESIAVYLDIIKDMAPTDPDDIISLRKQVADLYVAAGDYSAAKKQYREIGKNYQAFAPINNWAALQLSIIARSKVDAKELGAYSKLLQSYLSFIPSQDGYKVVHDADAFLERYPHTPIASNVDKIREESLLQADKWYAGIWMTVDKLTDKSNYEDAINLLQSVPMGLIDQTKASSISKKIDELILADAVNRETHKMAQMQELQQQWNNGLLLVSGERFSEAINVFKGLEGTEYNDKALNKIEEVSLLAAKAERRKAADIFIRYTRTTDLASQKKLLIESRKILKNILISYPQTEIIGKTEKNISRVEEEMNKIDPQLLPRVRSEESGIQTPATPKSMDVFDQLFN
ncbi:hypothetical protein [Desulfotalea psychrophila]|uniref:Uncharacterized protein n=1 Tax=Desulfotalea psychrophila (strain LSv54 / DSM 12343) TaxID=177439 RepID=Q6AMM2_DESPS|nr:hypothetical protein [Desulfotalea psychrophila]CAG36403.1 unknown protein [Desulfotalea psychrophila LSv54]